MKKLNQKGFTGFEIALLILVLAALGFAGYTVWQKNKPDKQPQVAVEDTKKTEKEETPKATNRCDTDHQEFKSEKVDVSFCYPKSWAIAEDTFNAEGTGWVSFRSADFVQQKTESGASIIQAGGKLSVTVAKVQDERTSVEFLKGTDHAYYFKFEKDTKVAGEPAVYGLCGHYSGGTCVYVIKNGYEYNFGYYQKNTNSSRTADYENKYLSGFNTLLESAKFN